MKQLPIYAKELLLMGAITGTFTEGYHFVEERIQVNHAKELLAFCQWIDKNIGGAARGNIDMLFMAYKNPDNTELAHRAAELAEQIRYIRSL